MPAVMRCSRWSGLPARTISTHRHSCRQPIGIARKRPDTPNKRPPVRPPIVIPADQSVLLRNRLLEELSPLTAADDLTLWALRRLPTRNTLQQFDAEAINTAYLAKLENIQSAASQKPELARDQGNGREACPAPKVLVELVNQRQPVLDRVPAFDIQLSKTLRRRNKAHLLYVGTQPCLICQRTPCDAHHLKFADLAPPPS